jgi:NADH-quinone oxidoreductase subunit G
MSTRREAVAGGRTVIKRIMPRQNESVNEIWICDKGRFVHHYADASDRLTKPLVRKDGQLVETSWNEALDRVAGMLQTHKSAVAGLTGDRLSNEDLFLFQKLFRQGLASDNIDLANSRLAGGEVVAKVGVGRGSNLKELGAGDVIVVVATDLHEEAPVWWLRVKQAAERGATLVVLNARLTRLDEHATHALYYAPGRALTVVRQLLSAAKVEGGATDGDALAAAAEVIAKANNLVAFYGAEGLTYNETGALAKLLANLLLIQNGASHVGRANNGLIPVWPHSNTQGAWDMGIHPRLGPGYIPVSTPGLGAADIYAAVADGGLKALYVLGADPVGDGLMDGRGRLDFLVAQELFMTETAALADVVLPGQSWAEREGTFTNGERRVQRYYPGISRVGDSRPDWQILAEVGERVGLGKPAFAASLVFRDIAAAVPPYRNMDYRSLARVEKQWPDVGGDDLYYGGTAYENRSGLGQQWPVAAESGPVEHFEAPEKEAVESAAEGMTLIRTAALYTPGTLINHTGLLAPRLARPTLYLQASDAGELQVADGDMVIVTVNGATIEARAYVNSHAPAGVALLRGVPYQPGRVMAEVRRAEVHEMAVHSMEKELV